MLILQVHVIYSSLKKEVYNPQAVIPHAVLLRQAFAHCGKFPTAASRRSLGRVSVPVWLIILSNQLLIIALVGLYPTNQLIRRELLLRQITLFTKRYMGHQQRFPAVISHLGVDSHALLTRPPLESKTLVRLACVKHTASVHPEPGSNSHKILQNC